MTSEQRGSAGDEPVMGPMTRDETATEWAKTAEELLKGLPTPSLEPLPDEQATDLSKYKNRPAISVDEAWQKCADAMRKYDADSCKAYREEIDTLLVFAGLFSAVVTAFTIESYQWLQSDPNDAIIALLSQIAHAGNGTQTAPVPKGLPDAVSTRINVYWFLSLALSLSAALSAILCKQWVREFERHADQAHEQYISVRQMKLEGFEVWGVAAVVSAVPLLLQSALGLFAVGAIELLWNLHRVVAIVVLVPTASAFVFYALTTLLPALQAYCSPFKRFREFRQFPFKSPQALLVVRVLFFMPLIYIVFYALLEFYVSFLHRTCVVFWRRVRTYWRPDQLPSSSSEAEARSFWQRLLRPWRCDGKLFYQYEDEPNWHDVRRWMRKVWRSLFSCAQDPHRGEEIESTASSEDHSYKLSHDFPTLDSLHSWVALDREFTRLRDTAYTLSEYQDTFDDPSALVLPPFCFSALTWIRQHVYQPAISRWTWMCVWDMAKKAEQNDPLLEVDVLRYRQGILEIAPVISPELPATSTPCAMALLYGLDADMEPAFIAEAFIHLLPTLDIAVAHRVYSWIIDQLGDDEDWMHSVLHAILSLPLTIATEGEEDNEEGGERSAAQDIRLLLLLATHVAPYYPRAHSQRELACIVALYFRELCAHGASTLAVPEDLRSLLIAAIKMVLQERDRATDGEALPAEQRAVFAALARAVDSEFDRPRSHAPHLHDPGLWEPIVYPSYLRDYTPAAVAERLVRPEYRRVYLDLLSDDALGVPGAPEERFERNVARLVRRRRSRSSDPGNIPRITTDPARESPAPTRTSGGLASSGPGTVPDIQVFPPTTETEIPVGAEMHAAFQDVLSNSAALSGQESTKPVANTSYDQECDVPEAPGGACPAVSARPVLAVPKLVPSNLGDAEGTQHTSSTSDALSAASQGVGVPGAAQLGAHQDHGPSAG